MHVFDASEITVECGREDDDGDVGAGAAEIGRDFSAELTGSEVVVEDGDVYVVEELGRFFDGGGRDALVAMLPKDGCAEMQVGWFVIKQEDADIGRTGSVGSVVDGWFGHR